MNTTLDDSAETTAMPGLLKVLLGILAVGAAFDLATALQGGGTSTWVRMAIAVACIIGLLKGSEGVRAVLRAFGMIGMLVGGFFLIQSLGLALRLPMSSLVAMAVGGAVLTFGISLFMFVVLGRHDVQTWVLRRSVGAA